MCVFISFRRDCALRSIIIHLRKSREWIEQYEILIQKLQTLGLGQSIDEDIYHLRQLFVDHVQSNDFYQMLIGTPLLDLNTETERFREEGTFSGEVGDLVIKVCSDIFCVPIMVVTNTAGTPYLPFIPDESVTGQPLFIAITAPGQVITMQQTKYKMKKVILVGKVLLSQLWDW